MLGNEGGLWRDATKQRPPVSLNVLVLTNTGEHYVAYRGGCCPDGYFLPVRGVDREFFGVTHWMFIPEFGG